jgi:hypothetical protein
MCILTFDFEAEMSAVAWRLKVERDQAFLDFGLMSRGK